MTVVAWSWIAGVLAPPLAVAVLGRFEWAAERLRAFAVACAGASLTAGALVFFVPELGTLQLGWS